MILCCSRHTFIQFARKLPIMNLQTLEKQTTQIFPVAPGVWGGKDTFVNFYFIQDQASGSWALIDAGLKWSAEKIKTAAKELFGHTRPVVILLTHGHFDHIGALSSLIDEWGTPVYAHALELPYLTGQSSYPPADPTVGGGMMAWMSFMYPKGPANFREAIRPLPADNSVPGLDDWKYLHTPGHAPGHVSYFRDSDKVLIAGDAFVTTRAESAIYALTGMKHLSGPPKYLTCNWASAKQSVMKLNALSPEVAATGHGKPMRGEELQQSLDRLVRNFDRVAVPAQGRYVNEPAVANENGVQYIPKGDDVMITVGKIAGISLLALAIGWLVYSRFSNKKSQTQVVSAVAETELIPVS